MASYALLHVLKGPRHVLQHSQYLPSLQQLVATLQEFQAKLARQHKTPWILATDIDRKCVLRAQSHHSSVFAALHLLSSPPCGGAHAAAGAV